MNSPGEETHNDRAAAAGANAEELLPLVYDQLRRIAQQRMNEERRDHTLQATALVHEAFARISQGRVWANKGHFFHAAAEAMRRILIEHARARGRVKRGGDERGRAAPKVSLNVLDLAVEEDPAQVLALEEAFRRLEEQEPDVCGVVRLRFFAGLSVDETAAALGVSARHVDRRWAYARAWLLREIGRA